MSTQPPASTPARTWAQVARTTSTSHPPPAAVPRGRPPPSLGPSLGPSPLIDDSSYRAYLVHPRPARGSQYAPPRSHSACSTSSTPSSHRSQQGLGSSTTNTNTSTSTAPSSPSNPTNASTPADKMTPPRAKALGKLAAGAIASSAKGTEAICLAVGSREAVIARVRRSERNERAVEHSAITTVREIRGKLLKLFGHEAIPHDYDPRQTSTSSTDSSYAREREEEGIDIDIDNAHRLHDAYFHHFHVTQNECLRFLASDPELLKDLARLLRFSDERTQLFLTTMGQRFRNHLNDVVHEPTARGIRDAILWMETTLAEKGALSLAETLGWAPSEGEQEEPQEEEEEEEGGEEEKDVKEKKKDGQPHKSEQQWRELVETFIDAARVLVPAWARPNAKVKSYMERLKNELFPARKMGRRLRTWALQRLHQKREAFYLEARREGWIVNQEDVVTTVESKITEQKAVVINKISRVEESFVKKVNGLERSMAIGKAVVGKRISGVEKKMATEKAVVGNRIAGVEKKMATEKAVVGKRIAGVEKKMATEKAVVGKRISGVEKKMATEKAVVGKRISGVEKKINGVAQVIAGERLVVSGVAAEVDILRAMFFNFGKAFPDNPEIQRFLDSYASLMNHTTTTTNGTPSPPATMQHEVMSNADTVLAEDGEEDTHSTEEEAGVLQWVEGIAKEQVMEPQEEAETESQAEVPAPVEGESHPHPLSRKQARQHKKSERKEK